MFISESLLLNLLGDEFSTGLTSDSCFGTSSLQCFSTVKVRAAVKFVFGVWSLFFQAPPSDFTRTDSPIREAPYSPTIQPVSSPHTQHSSPVFIICSPTIFLLLLSPFPWVISIAIEEVFSSWPFWPSLPPVAQPPLFRQLTVCRQGDPLRKWVLWPSLLWPGLCF